MSHPIVSKKRARSISTALFLAGLAVLLYTNVWWPGVMLVIGIALGTRQYLRGRPHDMLTTILIFGGVFVTYQFKLNISWELLLPVIFLVAAIYILMREFIDSKKNDSIDKEEDLNLDHEEDEN